RGIDKTIQRIDPLFNGILYVLDSSVVEERPLLECGKDVTVVPVPVLVFMAYWTVIDTVLGFAHIKVILAVQVLSVKDVDDEPVLDFKAMGAILDFFIGYAVHKDRTG
ncbi:hypothetical protein, partial [Methanomethylophilus alvi]|uniref:hypothetical protein n=1 Tax=Methanomethylophilus alvi TaxID=1291540 RepID=UPI0037DBF4EC